MAIITGTTGNDTLTTNNLQDDTFYGLTGNDTYKYLINGWRDTIYDTGGTDRIQFASTLSYKRTAIVRYGNDLIIDLQGSGSITVKDHYLSASSKMETLSFSGLTLNMSATNLYVTEKTGPNSFSTLYASNNADIIFAGGGEEQYLANPNQFQLFSTMAYAGNDTIYANYAGYILAGEGHDTVYGHGMDINLENGNDFFYGENVPSTTAYTIYVNGGAGSDSIYGTTAFDNFWGGADNDLIYGYGGKDQLHGGDGNDTIYGGIDNDEIGGDDGDDFLYGETGDDQIWGGNGIDTLYGGDGNDSLKAGDNIIATGNKTIYGEAGNDIIYDGAGNDLLSGGIGDDSINSNYGTDTIIAGDGNDYVWYGSGLTNTIELGNGDDTYNGQSFAGQIVTVNASSGNDILRSQHVNEVDYGTMILNGGGGNDTYYIRNGEQNGRDLGNITIFDESGSGDKTEVILYYATNAVISVLGNDLIITSTVDSGSITIDDHFVRGHSIETLSIQDLYLSGVYGTWQGATYSLIETLTTGANTYTASTSSIGSDRNIIDGLEGADTIHGANGDDLIYGGADNDTLYGDNGNDVLYGDLGVDTLYGGANADTFGFIFNTAFGEIDSIMDFSLAQNDKLHIGDLLNAYDPLTQAITDFVQITDNGANSSVFIDSDGAGSTYGFTQVATIFGVTGLTDEEALETSGNLITTRV